MGTKNRPYLPYNPDTEAGMPQRINPPVASQALQLQMQMAAENIKRTTGIDASLGARSNGPAGGPFWRGRGKPERDLDLCRQHGQGHHPPGCILVDMIPRIYDAADRPRSWRGQPGENGDDQQAGDDGSRPATINDMTAGRYDVNVSVGPSYSARREETRDGVQALLKAVPGAAQVIGDLYVSTLEWEHADRAAERMRKMLPPGIAEESEEDMTPEQMQAKQAQMMQAQQENADAARGASNRQGESCCRR